MEYRPDNEIDDGTHRKYCGRGRIEYIRNLDGI